MKTQRQPIVPGFALFCALSMIGACGSPALTETSLNWNADEPDTDLSSDCHTETLGPGGSATSKACLDGISKSGATAYGISYGASPVPLTFKLSKSYDMACSWGTFTEIPGARQDNSISWYYDTGLGGGGTGCYKACVVNHGLSIARARICLSPWIP